MYRLVPDRRDTFERVEAEAQQLEGKSSLIMKSPWAGIMPDIAPHNHPPNSCDVLTRGLIARPGPGGEGEVLMPEDGTAPAQGTSPANAMPLGSNNGLQVVGISELNRTNNVGAQSPPASGQFQLTAVAVVAGDGSTTASRTMHRLVPESNPQTWELLTFNTNGGRVGPLQGREELPDFAVMPEGAPLRTAYLGSINQPVIVWCNSGDQVMVYPCDDVGGAGENQYSFLTDQFGQLFQAKTVEAYRSRLFFGNTSESGTRHRQRIRWTATFTADPLVSNPGSGALDIPEFSRDLLRLEKLGDVLVAYFEDGTAFLRTTGNATAPLERQILKERRGLVSTHAMVSIGDNAHFGIFDDGWFLLDASGRWREVGVADINGQPHQKWKRFFYDNLDVSNRHRLYVSYDGNFIRIAYPKTTDPATDITEVWVFDIENDRVFITDRAAICLSTINQTIAAGVTWTGAGGVVGTWTNILGTWTSLATRFGFRAQVIGTSDGYVLLYDPDLITEYNTSNDTSANPTYLFRSILSALGQPRFLKTANRLWLEYINTNSTDVNITFFGNDDTGTETGTIDVSQTGRIAGEVMMGWRHADFTDTHLGFQINGTAPILIRSMEVDLFQRSQERRE